MPAGAVEELNPGQSLLGSWLRFLTTSVGSKMVMAVSGLAMWGFLIVHLSGNLLFFLGPEATNAYSAKLHAIPELLWAARIGLLTAIAVHLWAAVRTTLLNRAARPVPYAYANKTEVRLASTTMIYTGLIVLLYVPFHLAHLTLHEVLPQHHTLITEGPLAGNTDVYAALVRGFQIPWVALVYILSMLCIAGHLSHGVYSQFQHLGLWGPQWSPWLKKAAIAIGYGMSALFISIPLSVLANLVKLP